MHAVTVIIGVIALLLLLYLGYVLFKGDELS